MARVISHAYGSGVFQGVEFREEAVGGARVGVGHTTDPKALRWFESRRQFTVEYGDEPPARPEDAPPAAVDLEGLTVAQLREYATENGIDLGAATKKAEVIAVITEALEAEEDDGEEPEVEGSEDEAGEDDSGDDADDSDGSAEESEEGADDEDEEPEEE